MSILSPTYNGDLHFSDLVEVRYNKWNCAFFELTKLSRTQLKTGMADGTFEDYWNEIFAERYSETHTRTENVAHTMYKAISKYLKHDPAGERPRHIYMPSISLERDAESRTVWMFNIWDDINREWVFELSFVFKNN